ncbi:SgcJ/EcaC family oxidoreductase [Streptomyces sp. NBC_00503]|uniref:SgcJ/EcaC family oxidoreductase n=1 Tax=Streptomyces sp. NBC_00503 TaxID=2903659 RepID=UPI002E81A8A3|nr:SgcJ/EcaC family oxidoreductase [Streptomyces sp. NBC_00503]WUD79559.1 SgcJ/EcaC family oxidoreductase [Streptomyces sp. NBC_00503]
MKRTMSRRTTLVSGAALAAALGVTAVATTASAQPGNPPGQSRSGKPTQQQIAGLFDQWNKALATGDSKKVTALYAPDAVLLPTVSPKIRTNHDEIADYFDEFLAKKPVGKKIETIVEVLDRNTAIDTGLYRFTLTDKTGKRVDVDARYTYVYEKIDGKWLIINHHSSVLPAAS